MPRKRLPKISKESRAKLQPMMDAHRAYVQAAKAALKSFGRLERERDIAASPYTGIGRLDDAKSHSVLQGLDWLLACFGDEIRKRVAQIEEEPWTIEILTEDER